MSKSELVDVTAADSSEAIDPLDLVRLAVDTEKETVKLRLKGLLHGDVAALHGGDPVVLLFASVLQHHHVAHMEVHGATPWIWSGWRWTPRRRR